MKIQTLGIALIASTSLASCAALGGKTDTDQLKDAGVSVVSYEAESRGAYFKNKDTPDFGYCAEPPPDIALSRTLDIVGKVNYEKIGAEANAKLGSTAIELAGRTQLVLLARELLYRTCEMALNDKIGKMEIQDNYKQVIDLLSTLGHANLEFAQAENAREQQRLLFLEQTAAVRK